MTMTDFAKIAKGKNQVIKITNVAVKTSVEFPAFLTNFSDSYAVTWGNEQIYGRSDPVKPYTGTGRTIQIGFDVLAANFDQARTNLNMFSTLSKMLYPVYSEPLDGNGLSLGRTIKGPPLMRIKFVNLVQTSIGGGLLGCIEGAVLDPKREMGFFTVED